MRTVQPARTLRRRRSGRGPPGAGDRPAPAGRGPAARRRLLGSRRRQVIAVLVIAGAVAFLLLEGSQQRHRLLQDRRPGGGRQGCPGHPAVPHRGHRGARTSVRSATTTDFSIYANGVRVRWSTVPILRSCSSPASRWCSRATGKGPVYASDQIMVKHTASYVEAHPDRVKSQLPTAPRHDMNAGRRRERRHPGPRRGRGRLRHPGHRAGAGPGQPRCGPAGPTRG